MDAALSETNDDVGEAPRPRVTWSYATTLDGRSAAADGTSRWISSPAALRDTHRLRSECDAIVVGTETTRVDNPALTARDEHDLPLPRQPLRVIVGLRDLDPAYRVFDDAAETLQIRTHDPSAVLAELSARGCRRVLLEGGPTLAASFVRAGVVDEVIVYIAPKLLGAGRAAVADFGVRTMSDALEGDVTDIAILGGQDGEPPNVRITLTPRSR